MSEPIVFLPGMMCDARVFGPQIAALSGERAVQVAPLLGETVEEMAISVLETAPPEFALAGHSLGGMVAMEILRRAPKRVLRLALIATNAQSEPPTAAATREERIVVAKSGRLRDALGDEMRREYLADGPYRAEIRDMYVEMGLSLGTEAFVRQSRALQRRPDQQSTLRKCGIPTLVICGALDALAPVRRHEFMATLIPRAKLEVIADAGHLPMLEQPDDIISIMSGWLDAPLVLARPLT